MRLVSRWIICLELSPSARLPMTDREAELETGPKGLGTEGEISDARNVACVQVLLELKCPKEYFCSPQERG